MSDKPIKQAASSVKSADRVIKLFEYFAHVQAPRALMEIARDLGYPASSTLALLKSLQALGYVSYDIQSKSYLPTIRLALLSNWMQVLINPDGAISRLMDGLQEKTNETIILGIQNGVHAHYLHVVQAKALLRIYLNPGTLRPIFRSAIGQVLLSEQSRESIEKLMRRVASEKADEGHEVDIDQFMAQLGKIRKQGYSYVSNQITVGAGTYAMLLPRREGQPRLAVGVGGPTSRLEPNRKAVLDAMKHALAEYEGLVVGAAPA